MAAVTAPAEVSVQHQKLLHFVANSPWSDEQVLAKVREMVVPQIERHGPIEVWIIDDTSSPSRASTRSACITSIAASSANGLSYVAGIVATVKVVAAPKQGASERRMSVKQLALSLPKHGWRTITWREGSSLAECCP